MILVEIKCKILTFNVGYTFLQDTLYSNELLRSQKRFQKLFLFS